MSSMTFILFYQTFFLNKLIPCTVTPENMIYLISEDKLLTFEDFWKNIFYFEGNVLYS